MLLVGVSSIAPSRTSITALSSLRLAGLHEEGRLVVEGPPHSSLVDPGTTATPLLAGVLSLVPSCPSTTALPGEGRLAVHGPPHSTHGSLRPAGSPEEGWLAVEDRSFLTALTPADPSVTTVQLTVEISFLAPSFSSTTAHSFLRPTGSTQEGQLSSPDPSVPPYIVMPSPTLHPKTSPALTSQIIFCCRATHRSM